MIEDNQLSESEMAGDIKVETNIDSEHDDLTPNKNNIEHADLTPDELTFNEQGLIPCIVQDALTGDVLMMAWMNEESLRLSIAQKTTWFYSRSRACLWRKGESSGNTQTIIDLRYDCDADCLLARVVPAGPACHTGEKTCFYRAFDLGL